MASRDALLHECKFDWDQYKSDDFMGEAILDLSKYADGSVHFVRLELEPFSNLPGTFLAPSLTLAVECSQVRLELDQYDSRSTDEEIKGHVSLEVQFIDRGRGAYHR